MHDSHRPDGAKPSERPRGAAVGLPLASRPIGPSSLEPVCLSDGSRPHFQVWRWAPESSEMAYFFLFFFIFFFCLPQGPLPPPTHPIHRQPRRENSWSPGFHYVLLWKLLQNFFSLSLSLSPYSYLVLPRDWGSRGGAGGGRHVLVCLSCVSIRLSTSAG
ncbi:hypothetical protein LY78DRAFT_472756 [Colletotrichum sublineola]|nr:hypothetical protein LY78DRAFT_472756 [Colletotrichum sublineola]